MHKICKLRFVALCVGGMGLTLYDPSNSILSLHPRIFPIHYWSLYSWDTMTAPRCLWPSVVILTPSTNTNSASSARSCVFTTRALLSAIFWSHWLGSHISFLLDKKVCTMQLYNSSAGPPPAESSARHTWLTSGIHALRLWIKMDLLIAYHLYLALEGHPVLFLPGIRSLPLHRRTISRNFCTCWWYGHFRASNLDVAVNQQGSVCTIIIKNLGHGVYIYGGLGTRTVASISSFKKVDMVLPIIRLKTSLTRIGRIPRLLSSGISVQEG